MLCLRAVNVITGDTIKKINHIKNVMPFLKSVTSSSGKMFFCLGVVICYVFQW